MKDIFEIVALDGLLSIEQVEEFLHERGCYVDFELSDLYSIIHNQIKEKLVDFLQMGPGRVHIFFLLDTSLSKVELSAPNIGQRTEDVFLNHLHDRIKIWEDYSLYAFLVI